MDIISSPQTSVLVSTLQGGGVRMEAIVYGLAAIFVIAVVAGLLSLAIRRRPLGRLDMYLDHEDQIISGE